MAYQFASKVCGIPCIIRVDTYFKDDEEVEYTVLDRTGYPAAWLERKLSPKEHLRIIVEISQVMAEECYGDYDDGGEDDDYYDDMGDY